MKDWKLGIRLGMGFGLVLLLLVLVTAIAWRTIETYKVNGPVYQHIIQGKDLLADVLPPPLFILESWKTVQEMHDAATSEDLAKATQRLFKLKKDYDDRRGYWHKETLEPELVSLMDAAFLPADQLFTIAFGDYPKVLQTKDRDKTTGLMKEMEKHYDLHRKAIDDVVRYTNQRSERAEKSAKEKTASSELTLIVSTLGAVLAGMLAAYMLTGMITGALSQGIAFAQDIARGNLTATIHLDQKDEIGQLAAVLKGMVEKLREVVGKVSEAAVQVSGGSGEISATAHSLSQGATQQAASIEETSSAMEEMASNISQNTENATTTQTIARRAAEDAAQGGIAVGEAVNAMKQIASKIGIIEEI
ncbi:MAG: methyl-accepting chemotaxis protein, partial [Magnetococcales bacterium]|nr:methyl-accepting chemotaxis protein [Magnetococcales bacterium]